MSKFLYCFLKNINFLVWTAVDQTVLFSLSVWTHHIDFNIVIK
jgi:hypothetical protein